MVSAELWAKTADTTMGPLSATVGGCEKTKQIHEKWETVNSNRELFFFATAYL